MNYYLNIVPCGNRLRRVLTPEADNSAKPLSLREAERLAAESGETLKEGAVVNLIAVPGGCYAN